MDATCWSDYLCPWCYVGQHRDALLADLGVTVVHLPYELHPEIPPEGRRIRPDGRLRTTFDRIEAECDAAGMPFRRPERMPNTRRALETAEWVRRHHADAFAALHRSLFAAQFANGSPLDDPDVLDQLVADAGAPADEVRTAVDGGHAAAPVTESMDRARSLGVTSTPTWVLDTGFVLPGALVPEAMARWVSKIVDRTSGPPKAGPEPRTTA